MPDSTPTPSLLPGGYAYVPTSPIPPGDVRYMPPASGLLERSPSFAQIAMALAKAQGAFGEVVKNCEAEIRTRAGPAYTYSYADLAAIRAATAPALAANGLALIASTATVPSTETSSDGSPLVDVKVQTDLIHESGEWFRTPVLSVLVEADDIKEIGIATTYFRRYQAQNLLDIAAEQDTAAAGGGPKRSAPPPSNGAAGNFLCRFNERHATAAEAKGCTGHTGQPRVEKDPPDRTLEPGQDPASMDPQVEAVKKAIEAKDWRAAYVAIGAIPKGTPARKLAEELYTEARTVRAPKEA